MGLDLNNKKVSITTNKARRNCVIAHIYLSIFRDGGGDLGPGSGVGRARISDGSVETWYL